MRLIGFYRQRYAHYGHGTKKQAIVGLGGQAYIAAELAGRQARVPALLQQGPGLRARAVDGGLHRPRRRCRRQPAGGDREDADLPRALRRLPAPAVPDGPRRAAAGDRARAAGAARRARSCRCCARRSRPGRTPRRARGARPTRAWSGPSTATRRRASRARTPTGATTSPAPRPTRTRQPKPGRVIRAAQLANDAWEALLAAHAEMMRQFAAEDIWNEVSMREYDVLYTLSKCRRADPARRAEPARPAQPARPVPDGRPAGRARAGRARGRPGRRPRRPARRSPRRAGRSSGGRAASHARTVSRAMTAGLSPTNSASSKRCAASWP